MRQDDKEKLWRAVLGEIEVGMSPANFQTWFKNTSLDDIQETSGIVIIRVPNDFTKGWLQQKYQKEIHRCLNKHLGRVVVVQYIVGTKRIVPQEGRPTDAQLPANVKPIEEVVVETPPEGLNPKLTFEQFVVGENSKLCHAAAESVARQPGANYNPLFIYGGVGLGKTHLLQAIGNEILKNNPKARVTYITSERFTNEMVEAIRQKETKGFKDRYRRLDCLLIDDIQFVSGKEQTQEEFFHTFNALHNAGKQIVMTSDRPPKAIPALEERLRSRLGGGMTADISAPSYETRLAILQSKAAAQKKEVATDILEYIAKSVKNNVRELEGALTRVLAFADLNNATPTLDDAKNLLGGILNSPGKKIVRPSEIIRAVANHFNLKKEDICGRKRTREVVVPRQILTYFLREELDMPYAQIGHEIGGRDHTTIIHDYNKIKETIINNDSLDQEITQIKNKLYVVD